MKSYRDVPAGHPTMSTSAEYPHRIPAWETGISLEPDRLNWQTTVVNREPSVTVTHENLHVVVTATTTSLEDPSSVNWCIKP
jgi:hypothetical protein